MRLIFATIFMMKVMTPAYSQVAGYWQQNVDYTIHVTLDDEADLLRGQISMRYTNNSPDTLNEIRMHVWPNAYSGFDTELGRQFDMDRNKKLRLAGESELGRIDSIAFTVDGRETPFDSHPEHVDVALLSLSEPLLPGGSITIETPFRVKIPAAKFSRLGHSSDAFQITQWYPKPAVYDKEGWHDMPYLNQGEFYSEFGDFNVYITVPDNYTIAASGELQTAEERARLLEIAEATAGIETFPTDNSFPESSDNWKTLHYTLENAHDFAWFADKRFHVLRGEVELPFSGRVVETWSYFTNFQPGLWKESVNYLNRSVLAYSNYVGEYQWPVAQALEGALSAGAGMEYPTITIIGQSASGAALDNVITHEVGHNWFYGMLGSNERDYAWMDEGINSYYESRYMNTYYDQNPLEIFLGPAASIFDSPELREMTTMDLTWYLISGLERMNMSQPVQQHSNEFTGLNYGVIVYMKTAYLMRYMADFLGQGQFDRVMSRYFDEWKMKHPQPADIRRVFEEETGEDMSWFFDGLLLDSRSLDYKIKSVQNGKNIMSVRVKNNTGIAAPFPISLMNGDSVLYTEWHRGFTGQQSVYVNKRVSGAEVTHVRIDAGETIPDNNRENNTYKLKGLFKKYDPLLLAPFTGMDNPYRTSIYYMPLIGGNVNDGFMLGLGLWNSSFPVPAVEWVLAPFYSFRQQQVVGQGSLGINLYPENGPFSRARVSGQVATYHISDDPELWYRKIQPTLDLDIRRSPFRSLLQQSIRARVVNVTESYLDPWDVVILPEAITYRNNTEWFSELQYAVVNRSIVYPYSFTATVQHNRNFTKAFAELNYDIVLGKRKIETRFFAGWMGTQNDNTDIRYQYSLTGVGSLNDYLYDEVFPGRNATEGMWANQMARRDGFFKLPARYSSVGWSDDILLAVNAEFKLPNLPVAVFADAGYTGEVVTAPLGGPQGGIQYDAGVMLQLIDDYVEVYFPLLGSSDLADPFAFNYAQYIMFNLDLAAANPFELLRKLRF